VITQARESSVFKSRTNIVQVNTFLVINATPVVITVLLALSYLFCFCPVMSTEIIHRALKNRHQIACVRVYRSVASVIARTGISH
jgi:hypothetical protein